MTVEEFTDIVRTESGLEVGVDDLRVDFDDLAGWDSLHLLKLISVIETTMGRRLPVGAVLRSRCLADVYELVEKAA